MLNFNPVNIKSGFLFYICVMEFKVGDRVIGKGHQSEIYIGGQLGTIKKLEISTLCVEFDYSFHKDLHNCDGVCKSGYGFYVDHQNLQLVTDHVSSFKVGDRVIGNGIQDGFTIIGMIGTIKLLKSNGQISVEFDNEFYAAHTCNGYCKDKHGFNVDPIKLNLVNITHTPLQAASGGSFINVITGSSSIPTSGFAGYAPIQGYLTQPLAQGTKIATFAPNATIAQQWGQQWTSITETPPPSPYLHKEATYVGKSQQFNAIIHNKQIDEFLLLN